jgi:hypothetical protein
MWTPDPTRLVKVRLHNRGEDVETPWAEDLGPAPGSNRARRVRLANVPFFHAKPTYEDVIVVEPDEDGMLAWNADGAAWEDILTRIDEDSGRWVMIVDYTPNDPTAETKPLYRALDQAAEAIGVCAEGAIKATFGKPGRMYLAVPAGMTIEQVMSHLQSAGIQVQLRLEHPVDDEEQATA